ncbi:hypothetical protein ABZZ44_15100 [Streptomyces sp. NPDC006460]|uniref:DUF4760 domain-containing protein n=1 Tax=Streptomyces sp. NPDC006460 TaxID=3154304 RepID=UPI00339DF97B
MDTALPVLSLTVAILAALFAAYTWKAGQRQNRRDLFLALHQRLSEPDAFRGRRLLADEINSVEDALEMRRTRPEDWRQVVSAVSYFDLLALYVKRDYVDRGLVMDELGSIFARAWEHGSYVLDARQKDLHWRPWANFEQFGNEALAWHNTTQQAQEGRTDARSSERRR